MTYKAIFIIVPTLAALLGAVLIPPTPRITAQVDCNATPSDPSCQSSSDNNNPPADNSQPPQPSTQTCPDGSTIDASATCPSTAPPAPQTQTCPDGSVIDASATCPTQSSTSNNNNQPTLSCNPSDSNPPSACRQASQPDSTGSCPSGTGITPYGSCCPHGTTNVHAFCDTQGSQDAKAQRALQFDIGAACTMGGLVGGPIGHIIRSTLGQLVCQ